MDVERWQRVKDLCTAALALDGEERDGFVDEACGNDVELSAEVKSLLACASQAEGFLETTTPLSMLRTEPAAPSQREGTDPSALEMVGRRLLHYEILEKIGEGGMGIVYRARDVRLGRTVALKFLTQDLSDDAQALGRFRLEARWLSALNHPRICTLHDIGEYEGRTFLVLEYLNGETLAARLAKGPIPAHEALELGKQIVEGLEAAHDHGIVHRDLKPGNVMVTAAGVKLLDFGLAKASAEWTGSAPQGTAPVSTIDSTLIRGTVPYMSPEQLEGKRVDARTDIWAFGTILYEMIAGRRAFDAPSQASLIASILDHHPPSLVTVAPLTPPRLQRVVARCLAKAPEERWDTAHDLVEALREVQRDARSAWALPKLRAWWWAVAAATLLLLVAAIAATLTFGTQSRRFTIALPADKPLAPGGMMPEAADRPALALTRDGRRLAYVAKIGDHTQICIRDMATGAVQALAGTEGGHSPFFSPDGTSLAFFAEGKLKKMPSAGGAIEPVADAPNPYGGTWGEDGWIYFTRHSQEGVHRVRPDAVGGVETVTPTLARMPEMLGSGQGMLATSGEGTFFFARDGTRTFVVRGFGARLLPTGHLVYSLPGRLVVSTLDMARPGQGGAALTVRDDLRTGPYGVAQFTVGYEGTLVYASGRPQNMSRFVWVDRQGRTRPAALPEAKYSSFGLSPDGRRLVVGEEAPDGRVTQIWLFDLDDGRKSSLTARVTSGEPPWNSYPRWTPDGRGVVYFRRRGAGLFQLALQRVDGSAEPVELWSSNPGAPGNLTPMSFSPDGSTMLAFGALKRGSLDIVRFLRDKQSGLWTQGPELVLATPYSEYFGEISPDGHWLLFTSDQSGRDEIYVTSYPTPGALYKVSSGGGHKAAWNGTSEIVYKFGLEMYAVDVSLAPKFVAGQARRLFAGAFPNIPGFDFAVKPGSREFLMLENKEFLQPATALTVITHFFDDLNRRTPSRRP